MANYLTVALDLYAHYTMLYVDRISPGWKDILDGFGQELDVLLEQRGQNIVGLFKDLAIDCSDFIIFCQYHSTLFANAVGDGSDNCCGMWILFILIYNCAVSPTIRLSKCSLF